VACADDVHVRSIVPSMRRRVTTYGLDAETAEVSAHDLTLGPSSSSAVVTRRIRRADGEPERQRLGRLSLRVPGRHTFQNALAAVAVGLELGLPFEQIAAGLGAFQGVERRFERRGEQRGVLVIDDYGHHPTEIAAVVATARLLGRRVVVAFQPHRFTRTAALMHEFGPALAGADRVVLTAIYPAGEEPIDGVTLEALAALVRESVSVPVDVVPLLAEVAPALVRLVAEGDVVVTLGAGSIATVADQLLDQLAAMSAPAGGGAS
jgi:UDP-N-acetylmuramate--alanine ligase